MFAELLAFIAVAILIKVLQEYRSYSSKPKIRNIQSRYVFITGCDTGFGYQLAKRLDRLGVYVYAGCLQQGSVEKLNQETSPRVKTFLIDVTKKDCIQIAFNFVSKDLGNKPLWALVNNAGVTSAVVPFDWAKVEDYKEVFEVNLFGHIRTTLKCLPLIKRGGGGRIIFLSSLNGRLNRWTTPHGLSSHSMEALVDGLSYDLKPFNITVHALEPTIFKTPMVDPKSQTKLIKERWRRLDSYTRYDYGERYLQKTIENYAIMYRHDAQANLQPVITALEDAILAVSPRNRYLIGRDIFYLYPLSLLPFKWQFRIFPIIQKFIGIETPIPDCVK